MLDFNEYAKRVAWAIRRGACLAGHEWEGATYTTIRAGVDWPPRHRPHFIQERRCNRCGHLITHVRKLGYAVPVAVATLPRKVYH